MARASMQYTLAGFSAELDWRPLHFVKPLPPMWVCGVCGLVRPKTALLSCMHILCESCYDQCGQEGIHVCPVDNYENQDEDVEWRQLAPDDLLRREVQCWNSESGCQSVTAASAIAQHFQRDCGHHSICCVKCSASVLCSGLIAHLKKGFCNSVTVAASYSEVEADSKEGKTFLTLFRGGFERQTCELKEFMARIAADIGVINDRLNEISHGVNSSKEMLIRRLNDGIKQNIESLTEITCDVKATSRQVEVLSGSIDALSANMRLEKALKEELAKASRQTRDHMSQIAAAIETIKAALKENNKMTLDRVNKILLHVQLGVSHCYFFVKDFRLLQVTAMREGLALYEAQKVYLCGYCMSPRVMLSNEGDSIKLYISLILHKGDMDDAVPWPFEHRIKLTIIHPKDGGERVSEVKPYRSLEYYAKPAASSNRPCLIKSQPLDVKDLINDGYVNDDKLRAKWEIFL